MKNKLKLLIKDGLNKKLNTKWFKIVNILLLVIICLLLNLDTIIKIFGGDFDDPIEINIIDSTGEFYDLIKENYKITTATIKENDVKIKKAKKSYNDLSKSIKDKESNDIIVKIDKELDEYKVDITSFDYVDTVTITLLTNSINSAKQTIMLSNSSIDKEELANIYNPLEINRTYLSKDLDENHEMIEYISTLLIPIFIIPFFLLILLVIQMIGAEINEEKSSKSMEIIISSVSPKIHFISKIITSNLYAIIQSLLFVVYFVIGLFTRVLLTKTSLTNSFSGEIGEFIKTFLTSDILKNVIKCLPWVIIMILLSFIAYSLLAGILASMTTNQEDFQQLQTPLMILIMAGYFIAMLASTYEKSTFIIILSVIPFLSSIIAPVLLITGQIGIFEISIAIFLLVFTIYILIKFGSRIYKVGILNYNSNNLWRKILDAIKIKD